MPASARLLALLLVALAAALASTPAHASGEAVVVRFAPGTTSGERASILRDAGLRAPRHIVARAYSASARAERVAAALHRLRRDPRVATAARELRARPAQALPNDTGEARTAGPPGGWQSQQWDLVGEWGIGAPVAWQHAVAAGAPGGRGVKVAVVDTGVAYADRGSLRRSPELPRARILRGRDFVSEDAFPNDLNGHGTFVASTIAAAANNGYGMVGVAYQARIIPVRVLNAQGGAGAGRIARGIRYAADRGAQVVNVSIELFDPFALPPRALSITSAPEIRDAIRYASARGAVVVAASGNLNQGDVPGRRLRDSIIYVGGTTEHGCLGDYSNFGPGLDIVAPGGGADSPQDTDPRCQPNAPAGRNILQVTFRPSSPATFVVPADFRGTSMAAPHVTGVVALLIASGRLGASPTPQAVEARLKATARDLGPAGPDQLYGAGLVDAGAALAP